MASLVFMMTLFVMTNSAQADLASDGECPNLGDDASKDSVVSLLQADYQLSIEGHSHIQELPNFTEYRESIKKGETKPESLLKVAKCFDHFAHEFNWTCMAEGAENDDSNLHVASGWFYLSDEQFDEMVMDAAQHMKPPIQDHETLFEVGMGVGAALRVFSTHRTGLRVGGSDMDEGQVKVARKVLKEHGGTLPMLVHDMRSKHDSIPDESFDHVISYGALAMYLQRDEMLTAIAEAARMTKPGGSLLFTSFVPPDGHVGSIKCPVEKSFWAANLPGLGLEGVEVHVNKHQEDRYLVTCRKKYGP